MEHLQSEAEIVRNQLNKLESTIDSIIKRNARVELDKKWETSITRFLCVTAVTYVTINLLLWTIGGPYPPVHALVPTCGYMLSTLTFRKVKEIWTRRQMPSN